MQMLLFYFLLAFVNVSKIYFLFATYEKTLNFYCNADRFSETEFKFI